MSATSIQNAGTATTRSAKPKPIGASSASRSSQRGISSRTRSCPVTPRCSRPAASSRGISRRRQQHQLDALDPAHRPAVLPAAAAPRHRHAARPEPGDRLLLQPPLRRHPELQPMPPPRSATSASGRIMPPTAGTPRPCPSARVSAS